MDQITFSSLFIQLLNESGISLAKTYRDMSDQGLYIPYSSLAGYKNFTVVPTFERALDILDYYKYPLTKDELSEILSYSRQQLSRIDISSDKSVIRRGIQLSAQNISPALNADDLDVMLTRRIQELFPDREANLSTYINDLIKKDLIESGYVDGGENE